MKLFVMLLLTAILASASCGLLNAALGAGGVQAAKTPEAKAAARSADEKALDWLEVLIGAGLFGGGVIAENRRQKRKAKKMKAARESLVTR